MWSYRNKHGLKVVAIQGKIKPLKTMQTFYKTTTSILLFFFATLLLGCSSDVPAQGNNTVFIWNFDKPK